MNVLVVGGAGYLGGAVTDLLKKTKYNFRVYDGLLYEESFRKEVPFIYGDVRDKMLLKKQLEWADCVVWLAALVGDGACALNPDVSYEINEKTVGWLARNFDKRIIFMSTCSVYGAQEEEVNENSPVNPLSVYAATKLLAEKHLAKSNSVIFRLGTLFGVSDTYSRLRMDLVVNTLTARAFTEGRLKVFGGDQYRPILHVKDMARVIVDAIETPHTGIFNLKQENIKIVDLANRVKKIFPKVEIETVDMKFQDTRNYKANSQKAEKLLKFKPKLTAEDGVREIKELLEEHRILDIDNPRFTNQLYLSAFKTHLVKEK